MKKSLLLVTASFVALSFAAPAMAADLRAPAPAYTKAPAMMPVALYDWSGFYVGLNGGYGSSHSCWDALTDLSDAAVPLDPINRREGCHNATGGTFGGQIGYRWQASNWVFGVEGQGNWADFSGSSLSGHGGTFAWLGTNDVAMTNRTRVDGFGLITGQVGYAWNNVLLYVKGGAAVVDSKYDVFDTPTGALVRSASGSQWGGTVGVGLDVGFAPNWSVGVEWNHIFLGDKNVNLANATDFRVDRVSQDIDMALVRLNYKFGGPIVARY